MNVEFRYAVSADISELRMLDHVAQFDSRRVQVIEKAVSDGACILAHSAGLIVGYGILDYSFFHFGFVQILYVRQSMRRRGVGAALLVKLEEICQTEKLFTSTNESNSSMQSLLQTAGFLPSGRIENIDEADTELVFFKKLSRA